MTLPPRARALPACTAAACLALVIAATVWSAAPLYGPLTDEFRWPTALLTLSAVASLVLTPVAFLPLLESASLIGVRGMVVIGCLASGLIALLAVPNLTHLWQLSLALLGLGATRACVFAGCWHELRRSFGPWVALLLVLLCAAAAAVLITPWIAALVYRNSWREGAAACAGLLLVIATPLGYVLLPGPEVERCRDDSVLPPPPGG